MARSGRVICIPLVEEFNTSYTKFCRIKNSKFSGRAAKVLLRFLNFGIEKGWWEPKHIYKSLIWFGFNNNWIDDLFLASITLEYGFKDMNRKKDKSIKEVLENGEENAKS